MTEELAAQLDGKRIAILAHTHPSLTKGGAEIAAYTLFRALRDGGVDAILIAACEEGALERIDLGPNEFVLPHRSFLYDPFYHISSPEARRRLVKLLVDQNVAILNAHHFLYAGIGLFPDVAAAGIEVVFTIHEFLSICNNHGQMITRQSQSLCNRPSLAACKNCFPEHTRQQFAMRQQLFSSALSSATAYVSPSRFLADRMIENGLDASRMHIIENGISQERHSAGNRAAATRKLWKFGYFGQINPFKGVDIILDACARLDQIDDIGSNIRIVIHGNFVGQSDEFIARFKKSLEDYPFLTYRGPYDNSEVGQLMSAVDYVVVPSIWWENSPVVIQEARQARRPIICTGIGGMAEKVTDGVNGLHFARNDATDLADRIMEACDAPLYDRFQTAIPATVSPEMMAAQYSDVFLRLLAPAARKAIAMAQP